MKLECDDEEADAEMQQHGDEHEKGETRLNAAKHVFWQHFNLANPRPLHLHKPLTRAWHFVSVVYLLRLCGESARRQPLLAANGV